MNNHGFNEDAYAAFAEAAAEKYDFKQCLRADGSIYGIPDKSACVMGKDYSAKEVEKAGEDLFASAKKMAKSVGNLEEFNKALAEFTKANGTLQSNTSPISKLPLKATSSAMATSLAARIIKVLSTSL